MPKSRKATIALTWWGTWWHIFPLLSIYNYIKNDETYNFIWAWENNWLENDIANTNNIKFIDIPSWKLRRYFDIRNFYEPFKNLTGIFFAIYYILKYNINIVISKWWYVSLPLCIAAFILRKKIYIHESDTNIWFSNHIVSKLATKVFYTFQNDKIDNEKHILSWQILNPELLDKITDTNLEINTKLNILVIAWSQWSTNIFNILLKLLPDLSDIDFTIIIWDKNQDFKTKFDKFSNIKSLLFVDQVSMWQIYKTTDIAITRAWSTTIHELLAFWIHSIIIPLQWSAWNHQYNNAMIFKDKYKSDVLLEDKKTLHQLFLKIQKYKNLRKNGLNLSNFYNALKIIKNHIQK